MKTVLVAALGLCMSLTVASAGLVLNGDFESPNLGGTGSYYPAGSGAVSGWTVVGAGGVNIHHVNQIGLLWPGNNSQFLDLTGNTGGGGLSTTIPTTAGQAYVITFDAVNGSRWNNNGAQNAPYTGDILTIQATGGSLVTFTSADLPPGTLSVPPVGNLVPVSLSYLFTAIGTSTTLTFMDVTGKDSNAGWLDNVSISAVPEPATMIAGALLLLPFGVSTLRRFRKA